MPLRRLITSVREAARDLAILKHRAAIARHEQRADQERPRDVYLSACREVAEALAPDGFAYAPSRQRLTRKAGWHSQHVEFQSSHNNVPGERVALWVHISATSRALRAWRTTAGVPGPPYEWVGGGQIGNLLAEKAWIDWDLADPSRRPEAIADVVGAIERIGRPFFDACVNIDQTLGRLLDGDIGGFDQWPDRIVDLFIFKDRRADAGRYAKRFLAAIGRTTDDVDAAVRRQESEPYVRRDYVDDIATRVRLYRLSLP